LPDQSQWVSLKSGGLTAEVDPLGAQLSVLRDRAGRDLLWGGDSSVWAGRAPLLFPIVGALAGGSYRLDSRVYRLPRHGFARNQQFEVVDFTPASAVFRLRADAAIHKFFPFRFELEVHFTLDGATLSVTSWIRNLGDVDMPASFGYHPAFRWPLPYGQPRSAHYIEFADEEPDPIRRLDAEGLMTAVRHPTPILHRRLALADALFQDDAIICDKIRSRSVSYGSAAGPRIRLDFPDAPYLGIWTKPQAEFICIEPWHGLADPVGFSADFSAKPGVFTLTPGAALPIKMAITLLGT
jgi:galactose mutarotase-like enzyme